MNHKIHDIGVARQVGNCSDATEAAPNLRWLHTSGMPGYWGIKAFRRASPVRPNWRGSIFCGFCARPVWVWRIS
jgi:hypothetical protein